MLSPSSTHGDSLPCGHHAFLRRAAHDPQFLDALQTDPQAALAEYGLSVDPEQIPDRVAPPSSERILDVLIDVEDEDKKRRLPVWFGFLSE